jgi:hypothetical protein
MSRDLVFGFLLGVVVGTFTAECKADDWATTDKVLLGAYVVASAIDAGQTLQALDERNPDGTRTFWELNPVFGDYPSDRKMIGMKIAGAALLFVAADQLPKYRRQILWTAALIQVSVIAHNAHIGMRLQF